MVATRLFHIAPFYCKLFNRIVAERTKDVRIALVRIFDSRCHSVETLNAPQFQWAENYVGGHLNEHYMKPAPSIELEDIFGPLWFAVPKSKVTPSRKKMGGYHRGPKRVYGYFTCLACGKPKMPHKLCNNYELCARANAPKR